MKQTLKYFKLWKVDDQVNRILSNACVTEWSGMNVQLHINTQVLKVTQLECNDTLFQHTMQNISFACGGDLVSSLATRLFIKNLMLKNSVMLLKQEIQDFIAYVAKDDINGRACYVFECSNNLANSVITTVGQAFELRFKKFLNSMPSSATTVNATSVTNGIKQQKFASFYFIYPILYLLNMNYSLVFVKSQFDIKLIEVSFVYINLHYDFFQNNRSIFVGLISLGTRFVFRTNFSSLSLSLEISQCLKSILML